MIRSAVLLAAGRGNRQRPFTDLTPKPLLAVDGRVTLDYILCAVKRAGIQRICVITHHLEEQIIEFIGDGSQWKLEVAFGHQKELLGSVDALMSVPLTWIRDEPVMVLATDYLLEQNVLLELVQVHAEKRADITLSLKECPIDELMARSSVEVDACWRVKRIIEKPGRAEIMSPYAASFLFILPPQIWQYLSLVEPSPRGEIELQSAIDRMLQDGFKAYGILQPAPLEWDPARHFKTDAKPACMEGP